MSGWRREVHHSYSGRSKKRRHMLLSLASVNVLINHILFPGPFFSRAKVLLIHIVHTIQMLVLNRSLINRISISPWKRRFLLPNWTWLWLFIACDSGHGPCNGCAHRQKHSAILAQAAALLGGFYRGTGRSNQRGLHFGQVTSKSVSSCTYDDNFLTEWTLQLVFLLEKTSRECRASTCRLLEKLLSERFPTYNFLLFPRRPEKCFSWPNIIIAYL